MKPSKGKDWAGWVVGGLSAQAGFLIDLVRFFYSAEDQLPYGCGVACKVWTPDADNLIWRFDSSLVRFIIFIQCCISSTWDIA